MSVFNSFSDTANVQVQLVSRPVADVCSRSPSFRSKRAFLFLLCRCMPIGFGLACSCRRMRYSKFISSFLLHAGPVTTPVSFGSELTLALSIRYLVCQPEATSPLSLSILSSSALTALALRIDHLSHDLGPPSVKLDNPSLPTQF